MRLSDFDYDLPRELIAQKPVEPRDASRLMVVDRRSGAIAHRCFRDLPEYLRPGDALVINETRVMPARLLGSRERTGGAMEVLLLKRLGKDRWETLVKPGKKARPGEHRLRRRPAGGDRGGAHRFRRAGARLQLRGRVREPAGPPGPDAPAAVHPRAAGRAGAVPDGLRPGGRDRRPNGRAALHAGAARPAEARAWRSHRIDPARGPGDLPPRARWRTRPSTGCTRERYHVSPEAAAGTTRYGARGGRVVAVGTTSVRTLETAADDRARSAPARAGRTSSSIPATASGWWTSLITNFHLPQSTLLMLVSALRRPRA